MKATYRHRLQPPEYGFLAISTVGTIVAAVTQQVVYATVPLTLAMSLVLTKRQQFQQQTQQPITEENADVRQVKQDINIIRQELDAIAEVHQVKQDVDFITQELNTLSLKFNTRPESQQIDRLKEVIAQLPPQTQQFDPTTLILQLTEVQQFVADSETSLVFDKMVQIQTDMQLLQQKIEQQSQQDETLKKAVNQLRLRFQIVHKLCSEVGNLKQQQRVLSKIHEIQVQDITEAGQHDSVEQLKQEAEGLSHQIEILSKENKQLIEELSKENKRFNKHQFDSFETSILAYLQKGLPQQKILPQFDSGTRSDNSKFTDFVIVMENCIIAIEAKCYRGIIEPTGDPRNTSWTCQTKSGKTTINASWGLNPYQQINTYVKSILNRIRSCSIRSPSRNSFVKIPVYGVVVFPTEAEIVSSIDCNMGVSYRVTTVKNLLKVIHSLETEAQSKNKSVISSKKILDILLGSFYKE